MAPASAFQNHKGLGYDEIVHMQTNWMTLLIIKSAFPLLLLLFLGSWFLLRSHYFWDRFENIIILF